MSQSRKLCTDCQDEFTVYQDEIDFLEKIAPKLGSKLQRLPLPKQCPGCREQRRLTFRNEWHMYKRNCDFSKKELIAIYHPESLYTVYDPTVWWSDQFDPLLYGRDFDFSRPFFEQFHELNLKVPKLAIQNAKSENCAYTNYSAENKNCYLCVGSGNNEDSYYCSRVFDSRSVCDSYDIIKSENCYQCVHGSHLYDCVFSKNCHNSSALAYCEDCRGCRQCFGCTGLRNKSFCLFNQELTERAYYQEITPWRKAIGESSLPFSRIESDRSDFNLNCEDCSGDQLINCSRCHSCFSVKESQDCRYVGSATHNRDCYDCNFMDDSELLYFSTNLTHNYRVIFSVKVWYSSEALFCMNCYYSKNLFGCSGMKRSQYCILNKQYNREQYEKQLQRIIAWMKETGEWGEFFPISISPFPYNCTVAHELYPLPKDQALKQGLKWYDDDTAANLQAAGKRAGEDIQELGTEGIRSCSVTGKQFKIAKPEKQLCERLGVMLPTKCPSVRHEERMKAVKRAIRQYVK